MVYINPLGRNWDLTINWDFLGIFYVSFAIIWTALLYSGITWLYCNRRLPYLKIRNVPLAITATTFLHVYLVKILAAYTINGHFPCSIEFWIMSIYLPFGIALFQANMVQLLSISTQQRKLLNHDAVYNHDFWPKHYGFGFKACLLRWRDLNALKKTYCVIGIGMVLQIIVTGIIFSTSSKLQEHWGEMPTPRAQASCRKGLEWVPSALWQLFWSCFYGPYLLYKVRNVRDTHYWRLQTILCVVFGFPGSPMWLAAAFSPSFKTINLHCLPPLWLAPGIIIMQAATVFSPIYEAYILNQDPKNPNSTIHIHKGSVATASSSTSRSNSSCLNASDFPTPPITLQQNKNAEYSLQALEYELATNPQPLLHFSATKDFTAESIIFLLTVRSWRDRWTIGPVTPKLCTLLFKQAVEIYAQSVSEELAEFPINISGYMRGQLDSLFKVAAREMVAKLKSNNGAKSPTLYRAGKSSLESHFSLTEISWQPASWQNHAVAPSEHEWYKAGKREVTNVENTEILELCDIPSTFNMTVFNEAEDSIKYLVATNTWRKFVQDIKETERTVPADNFL